MRQQAADFWLNFLFWHARRQPWFARASKPFWMWASWTFSPLLRNNTLSNARRLLGPQATDAQRKALARAVIANFYEFVCDIGRALGMSRPQLLERIERIEGVRHYEQARRERKGAIIVTAHMGSFEVATAALLEHEKRIHVLFRRDALGLFERTRAALRKRLGVRQTCVDEGLTAWMKLRAALERDEVVLIQGDRVLPGQKGMRVPFLGGHVMLPTGPVKLALATGAPIIPIFSIRNPDGTIRLEIQEPIPVQGDVSAAVLRMASIIETYVRRYPDQWLVVHRPWCEDAPHDPG